MGIVKEKEIVFILDRSGSMMELTEDTIGGFNSMLDKQDRKLNTKVTLVLFDDKYDLVYSSKHLLDIPPLTKELYYARGSTALYDAIGKTLNSIRRKDVLCVIITDGYENASREYSALTVRSLITHKQERDRWEFVFLGANIDSFDVGNTLGINTANTVNYSGTSRGMTSVYRSLGDVVGTYTNTGEVNPDLFKPIE